MHVISIDIERSSTNTSRMLSTNIFHKLVFPDEIPLFSLLDAPFGSHFLISFPMHYHSSILYLLFRLELQSLIRNLHEVSEEKQSSSASSETLGSVITDSLEAVSGQAGAGGVGDSVNPAPGMLGSIDAGPAGGTSGTSLIVSVLEV